MDKHTLLKNLFYSPNNHFTSIKRLFDQLKNKGITHEEVRNFLQQQETTQLFKRQRRIKHCFPVYAKHGFEILQMDIMDMSDISTADENYKFMLVCVFFPSLLAFAVPLKKNIGNFPPSLSFPW